MFGLCVRRAAQGARRDFVRVIHGFDSLLVLSGSNPSQAVRSGAPRFGRSLLNAAKTRVQVVSRPATADKRLVCSDLGCGICGGPQRIVPAALLGGSVNVKTLTLLTEVPHVRLSLG